MINSSEKPTPSLFCPGYPCATLHLSGSCYELALSVKLAIWKLAEVDTTVWVDLHTIASFPALEPLAKVPAAVFELTVPNPTLAAIWELSSVDAAVGPTILALTGHFIVFVFALKKVAQFVIGDFEGAMLLVIYKVATVPCRFRNISEGTLTKHHIWLPPAFVMVSIGKALRPVAVLVSQVEMAGVDITVFKGECSLPIWFTVEELAIIFVTLEIFLFGPIATRAEIFAPRARSLNGLW